MTAADRDDGTTADGSATGEPDPVDDPSAAAKSSVTELGQRARERLERAREDPRDHRIALAAAVVVGLVLAWLHWFGLVLGGALVGLVSSTLERAVLAGLGFGVVVLIAFVASLGTSAPSALLMTPATYVTVGAALALPAFGSLVRGLG